MAQGRIVAHLDEAIVLRTWPFHEADLLVSLLTREGGLVKGVARHAMRSRRRFGGALEPGTYVRAQYAERPREDLVRLDSFEILWSPLRAPVDWLRMAGMQLVVEVLEQALPEMAPEDNVFRLAMTVLQGMEGTSGTAGAGGSPTPRFPEQRMGHPEAEGGGVWLGVSYFCVWMCRLMGWWPELGVCAAVRVGSAGGAGLVVGGGGWGDLRGGPEGGEPGVVGRECERRVCGWRGRLWEC